MFRPLMISLLLVSAATAAEAQSSGPPIAYVKVGGSSQEIYLVNPDGSGLTRLHTTGRKVSIVSLDLRPSGGEIAFIEAGVGIPRVIKILSFGGAGASGPTRTLTGPCAPDTVDYHPVEPRLIISDICNQSPRIATIGTDGASYSVLVEGAAYVNKARWLRDGISYVYVRAPVDGGPLQLCRNSCNPDSNDLLWTGSNLTWMDVGRTSNALLFDSGGSFIHKLDADTGALQSNLINGTDGHFSPDDNRVLYETPHSARGDYLHIRNADGTYTRLSGKGEYGAKDWRP